ncbi:MAG: class I SAM-dependent methyltransferase [Actinomycetota bacterium]|nr:class I SAM-dependent methyltransferase [Actinomycetota bacterium]
MTTTEAGLDIARRDALVERLFEGTIEAVELLSVHLGVQLGLYAVLADGVARTPAELARDGGIAERYAREWLEQQAVAGFLEVEGGDGERRFRLPAEHAAVLAEPENPAYVAPFAHLVAGIGGVLPRLVEAYRTGEGVPYSDYGRDFREGQGGINRPTFTHDLPGEWIPALPDVHERLVNGDSPRVAEIGSGEGWASIAVARAYPNARVDGFDADPASVESARAAAERAGVAARVRFEIADAATLGGEGEYGLVLVLETLHDLARPVEALAAMRSLLAPGGCVLVVDERVADDFVAPGDPTERMMYGWSVLHCLPTQLVEADSAALGTVLRSHTVEELAKEAGFARCTVLPIENDLFRLYRLDP